MQHIDIAKGIGISIIVLAHNYLGSKYNNGALFSLTVSFSFNMPLFYLLSGVFFKTSDPFAVVLKKKYDSVLVPYLATLLTAALVKFVIQDGFSFRFLIYRLKTILFGTGGMIDFTWTALWFLPSLFVTIISFKIVHSLFLSRLKNVVLEIIAVFAILVMGFFLMRSDNQYYRYFRDTYYGLPWGIDFMPISVFYFAMGYYAKPLLIEIYNNDALNKKIIAASLLVLAFLMLTSNAGIDLNRRIYDDLIVCTLKALSGILLIVGVSGLLEKSGFERIKKLLLTLGRLSLIVFIFHGIVQNTSFNYLTSYAALPKPYAGVISLLLALGIPVALYYLVITRIGFLQTVYAPVKKKQVPQEGSH